MNKGRWPSNLPGASLRLLSKSPADDGPAGLGLRHPLGTAPSELGRHRFHRMDIHAPQCINMGAISSWRNDHEKAQCAWDRRWRRDIDGGALLASIVARKCGPCGATANVVTC